MLHTILLNLLQHGIEGHCEIPKQITLSTSPTVIDFILMPQTVYDHLPVEYTSEIWQTAFPAWHHQHRGTLATICVSL